MRGGWKALSQRPYKFDKDHGLAHHGILETALNLVLAALRLPENCVSKTVPMSGLYQHNRREKKQ